jgi:hypothetical protein
MIFGVPGEPIHLCYDERIDVAFVLAAELHGPEELGAVGCFCRCAFLAEYFENLNILVAAIRPADFLLGLERGAFHLLVT